ncbi:oxidoreductase [Streptomyces sp. NPDC001941]|uniref:oxidoreductase n=1 Tax=Streptomyces sp. NPDC001941 TaxID=3154659 RepID=UPI003329C1B8
MHEKLDRVRVVRGRAVAVAGHEDRAEVTLDGGQDLSAGAVVVATGVSTLGAGDVDWVDAPDTGWLPPLWRAAAADLAGRRVAVLGTDQPLGTWLRAHPNADVRFDVFYPAADQYKTGEVADEPRVRLDLVERISIAPVSAGLRVTAWHPHGGAHVFVVDTVLTNMGSKPAALTGLEVDADGYCPPEAQHPRILVAGDLKGARMQWIAVAMGDGSRAALTPYYQAQAVPR